MTYKIAKCHVCNRYFKVERMHQADVGENIYIQGYVCTECWAKIETNSGAEEPTLEFPPDAT